MKKILFIAFIISVSLAVKGQSGLMKYSVPTDRWSETLGNHRAVIEVDKPSDALMVDFLWRRHDESPEKRAMVIVNAESGKEVKNINRVIIDNERCKLIFGPVDNAGLYYFYYLPSNPPKAGEWGDIEVRGYRPVETAPDSLWLLKHQLTGTSDKYKDVGNAVVTEIQSRTEFDSFFPMEVVATKEEVKNFLTLYSDEYLVFAEDRAFPIRMLDALPYRWIQKLPDDNFRGTAKKNEYYALQLGVFASQEFLQNVKLEFSDLKDKNGNTISQKAFTCYNTDGVDINGNPFTLKVDVTQGAVQPLWVGIDIPGDANAGIYEGEITVKPENLKEQRVRVILTVENDFLADRGDGEPWRHSRLRWLNSTLGIDDEPVAPYTQMTVDDRRISCLGRTVQLNSNGFPELINSWGHNILASSIKFIIQVNNQVVTFPASTFSFKSQKNGIVSWETVGDNNDFTLTCRGEMEFDGHMNYKCEVKAKTDQKLQDIRLEIPMKKEFATYMVGMGRIGGFTPDHHISRWTLTEDSFWIGETTGGIHCELRGAPYNGPLLNLFKFGNKQTNLPSETWSNGGQWNEWGTLGWGGFRIDSDEEIVTASAFSSLRKMSAGESITYEFALLITPVKQLDTKKHFTNRYFHGTEPWPGMLANGANIMNLHHANIYNPYINYPFIANKELRGQVDKWHEKNWKVKIYYTVRELSNYLTEIWALRSLGNEILSDGIGGGDNWLREHLVSNYTPQWYAGLHNGDSDEAIKNSGESRWYNYYVEGLAWLLKNMDIDGLYLDDVSFDRRTLKRMRKVMEAIKPGECMIDLHSNTSFSVGPVNQYLEFYPYIDRTWYGESFQYDNLPADFWLVETSGIPFGIMNDILLQAGHNTHKGMLYGMTIRNTWNIWELWDSFGIADSKMHGYWEKDPVVTTNHKDVYVTSYIRDGKTLLEVASWVNDPVNVKLNIDWKRLGLNPKKVKIIAPEVTDYQKERTFKVGESIPIDPGSDCLLIISEK